jgi:hypothetical protein
MCGGGKHLPLNAFEAFLFNLARSLGIVKLLSQSRTQLTFWALVALYV